MAIDAFDSQWSEKEKIGYRIGMTIKTVGGLMSSGQGKTAPAMDFHDIWHHPVDRGVAPGTIGTHRLVVYVGMAIHTLFSGFTEIQGLMALPATDGLMLSQKGEFGFAMIESQCFEVDFPTGRIVTVLAGLAEFFPMRRLLPHHGEAHHNEYY